MKGAVPARAPPLGHTVPSPPGPALPGSRGPIGPSPWLGGGAAVIEAADGDPESRKPRSRPGHRRPDTCGHRSCLLKEVGLPPRFREEGWSPYSWLPAPWWCPQRHLVGDQSAASAGLLYKDPACQLPPPHQLCMSRSVQKRGPLPPGHWSYDPLEVTQERRDAEFWSSK